MPRKHITDFRGEMVYTPNRRRYKINDEPISPADEGFDDFNCFDNVKCNMRKSLSMSDIATIKEELFDLKSSENKEDYSGPRKQSCTPELSKTMFVSMAEAIYRFQRDTRDRFRTSKPTSFVGQGFVPHGITSPQSPKLRCKSRARLYHIVSQKEREKLELEEIRKFQIKANPIPKSVMEGSKNLPEVQRKPITVPEPFKLTEVRKRAPPSPKRISNFKARPAPKHILERPVTKPISPKFHYKKRNTHLKDNLKKNENQPNKSEKRVKPEYHGLVKPEPFSFEKRDKEMKHKREERIKRQIEEERKLASQFKAQPLPAGVKKRITSCAASSTSSKNKENCIKIEAKPPTVLYTKPFKPVVHTQIIEPKPFDFAKEKRVIEREQFDKLLKEKGEDNEKLCSKKKESKERQKKEPYKN